MALLMRSQRLFIDSGQSTQSSNILSSLSSSSRSSTTISTFRRRNARFVGGISSVKCVPAQLRSHRRCRAAAASDGAQEVANESAEEGAEKGDRSEWDVSSNCVNPFFRVSPLASYDSDANKNKVHILFLSEGNVCRSVFAEAIFNALSRQHGLQDALSCSSKATRDYNINETADPRAVFAAEWHGLELPKEKVATVFNCSVDIVTSDLVLVMDKFTASDALKEVTVYEIINKEGQYSTKVRRLGEFCQTQQLEDIDDPLYGNSGDEEELDLVRQVYVQVRDSCEGLMDFILDIKENLQESESLKAGIARGLGRMDALNWLAPPMLSKV